MAPNNGNNRSSSGRGRNRSGGRGGRGGGNGGGGRRRGQKRSRRETACKNNNNNAEGSAAADSSERRQIGVVATARRGTTPTATMETVEVLMGIDPSPSEQGNSKLVGVVWVDMGQSRNSIDEVGWIRGVLRDGSYEMNVLLSLQDFDGYERYLELPGSFAEVGFVIEIEGYITSPCNVNDAHFCVVTNWTKIKTIQASVSSTDASPFRFQAGRRVQGGNIASFLSSNLPFLTNDELSGQSSTSRYSSIISTIRDDRAAIDRFLTEHGARMTLMQTTTNSQMEANASTNSSTASASSSTSTASRQQQYYQAAIKSFASSQEARQNASLTSNSGREDAERANLVQTNYKTVLSEIMSYSSANAAKDGHQSSRLLTREMLQAWHQTICGNGLNDAVAGQIRTTNVHAGPTRFIDVGKLHVALDEFLGPCQSALEGRLANENTSMSYQAKAVATKGEGEIIKPPLFVITYAAIMLYAILDLHPFSDGNGRLARLCCNWVLITKAGLPFPINLFATHAQRREYVRAIEQTRCHLTLQAKGSASSDDGIAGRTSNLILQVHQLSGIFAPLVALLTDRISRTISEFHKVCKEKSRIAEEDAKLAIVSQYRAEQAAGTCLICFDDNPNMLTICCGKAVHLNCMATWLSSRNSCPQCRGDLPQSITQPAAAAAAAPHPEEEDATTTDEDEEDETTETTTEEDDETEDIVPTAPPPPPQADDTSTTEDDTTEDDEQETAPPDPPAHAAAQDYDDTTTSEDDDITEESQEEDDDTTTEAAHTSYQSVYCIFGNCSNRAAMDCVNKACGRCCQMYGTMSCARHGC